MSEFWAGLLIGFFLGVVASLLANYVWDLRARYGAYKVARKLVGTWEAFNIDGRTIDTTPMPGATVVSSRRWWAADAGVLDVRAQDNDASTGRTRRHSGTIVFDRANPWLATRILRYADSNEISQQRLQIDPDDCGIVHIFPDPTVATLGDVYRKHVWRRKR